MLIHNNNYNYAVFIIAHTSYLHVIAKFIRGYSRSLCGHWVGHTCTVIHVYILHVCYSMGTRALFHTIISSIVVNNYVD